MQGMFHINVYKDKHPDASQEPTLWAGLSDDKQSQIYYVNSFAHQELCSSFSNNAKKL